MCCLERSLYFDSLLLKVSHCSNILKDLIKITRVASRQICSSLKIELCVFKYWLNEIKRIIYAMCLAQLLLQILQNKFRILLSKGEDGQMEVTSLSFLWYRTFANWRKLITLKLVNFGSIYFTSITQLIQGLAYCWLVWCILAFRLWFEITWKIMIQLTEVMMRLKTITLSSLRYLKEHILCFSFGFYLSP